MGYKKFKGDYLFSGKEMLDPGNVLITDKDGVIIEIVPTTDAGDEILQVEGIISPGFVNCHCHLELSHLKGKIPSSTGLVSFLMNVLNERNKYSTEQIIEAVAMGEHDAIAAGTVGIGDICNTAITVELKKISPVYYYNFIEVLGFTAMAEEKFSLIANISARFNTLEKQYKKNRSSLVPHAPYSVSMQLFEMINRISKNKTITIHNQEATAENDWYQNKEGDLSRLYSMLNLDTSFFERAGRSSIQTYLPWLENAQNLLLVHNTFTSAEDVAFVKKVNETSEHQTIYWCICANANLYIENRMPPIDLLHNNDCEIVLGTDSYASNHTLSILEEIKTILFHTEENISTPDILQWATWNGAKALQLNDVVGSFETGKKPGVLQLSNTPHGQITPDSSVTRLI